MHGSGSISPGQESVWDYPRPPRVEDSPKRVQVIFNGVIIADSIRTKRVLETSHPPVYYIPPDDIQLDCLWATARRSYCEYKGAAGYYTVTAGERSSADAAWYYPDPSRDYTSLAMYVAFYPSRVDLCMVDGERVRPQEGDFYGGWITAEIVGPFKGGTGTRGW